MTMVVRSGAVLRLVVVIALVSIASFARAEDFYDAELRAGKTDLAAGRTVQAIDELRVAAFGFLDRPPLLSEALVRLALAHETLGQSALVSTTVNRFLEVERRFTVYSTASIESQNRSSFEALLIKTVPRSELVTVPSMARMFRSDAAKVGDLPAEKRSAAYEQGFRRSPHDIEWPVSAAQDASARGFDDEAIRWSKRALSIDGNNAAAHAVLAHSMTRRGDCRAALAQIEKLSSADMSSHPELAGDQLICFVKDSRWSDADAALPKLPQAERSRADVMRAVETVNARHPRKSAPAVTAGSPPPSTNTTPAIKVSTPAPLPGSAPAKPASSRSIDALAAGKTLINTGRYSDAAKVFLTAANADPQNRDLRLALLEAASLSRDWRTAVAQISVATPFKPGEEASMFYAAAALYENGRREEARRMLAPARPRLPSTPLVDYYSRMILGTPQGK
jgi:tetratricopeptide (TPR) repeat protein